MWGCYVNSLKALSSLQATVTNFAANFISSGLAGYFLFHEPLPSKVTWEFSFFFAVHDKDRRVSIYLLHLCSLSKFPIADLNCFFHGIGVTVS
jgi:hypothetical protein